MRYEVSKVLSWAFSLFLSVLLISVSVVHANPYFGEPYSHCIDFIRQGQPSMPVSSDPVVCHDAYLVGYNPSTRDPYWVAYHLTRAHADSHLYPRTNNFRRDVLLDSKLPQPSVSDYSNSGYDKGHMDPAADNEWSQVAESESFYFTNVAPQNPNCNRVIWRALESYVRGKWVHDRGDLYVITGPIFQGPKKTIGNNQVAVPTHFYKIIYNQNQNEAISFIVPNQSGLDPNTLPNYIVSVNEVEKAAGVTFLPLVGQNVKNKRSPMWPH